MTAAEAIADSLAEALHTRLRGRLLQGRAEMATA